MAKMNLNFIFIGLISILVLLSCKDTSTGTKQVEETAIGEKGYIASYVKENSSIMIQKTTDSNVDFQEDAYWTYNGFSFTPEKNIQMTAIGGLIAETGTYLFELYSGYPSAQEPDTLLVDNITIGSVNEFQYKEIEPIFLAAGGYYVLWYKSDSYASVYDLGLGHNQSNSMNIISKPLTYNEITLNWNFEYYDSPRILVGPGEWDGGILRGLVDFKYQIVE